MRSAQYQTTLISGLIRKVRDVGPSPEARAAADAQPMLPRPQMEYLETVRISAAGKAGVLAAENDAAFAKTTRIESIAPAPDVTQPAPAVVASDAATTTQQPAVSKAFDKTVQIDLGPTR